MQKISYNALENEKSKLFWIVNDVLAVIILFSVVSIIFGSIESVQLKYQKFFDVSEWVVVVIFSVEYILHIVNSKKKFKYLFSFYGLIDLLAVLPTYLFLFDLRVLKVFRIVRLIRLLRLMRLLKLVNLAKRQYKRSDSQRQIVNFNLILYFASMTMLVICVGTVMYYLEKNAPGTTIHNIPEGMWLAISTVSTVTFGDVMPVTTAGKLVISFTMIAGLALLGLMVTIVGRTVSEIVFGEVIDDIEADEEEEREKEEKRKRLIFSKRKK